MNNLKFRVWNGNQMLHADSDSPCVLVDLNGDLVKTIHYGLSDGYELEGTRGELLQFTGLTDKWGTEVFDGDVVRQFGDWCVIERCVGGFHCKMIKGPHKGSTFTFSFLSPKYCEVMGNIYQNPAYAEEVAV